MLQFCGHVKAKWLIYTALMHSLHSSVHLFLLCFFSLVHSCECWEVFLKENDPNSAKKIPRSEVKMCRLMPPPPTHTNKYDMALSVATTHTGTYSYIYSIYIPMTNGFSGSVQSSCLKSHSVKWVFCTYRHRCMHLPEYRHLHPPPPFFFFFYVWFLLYNKGLIFHRSAGRVEQLPEHSQLRYWLVQGRNLWAENKIEVSENKHQGRVI